MTELELILSDTREVNHWAHRIVDDLLDANYCVANDKDTAIKIAVIRHLAKRNYHLEEALQAVDRIRDDLGKAISPVL